MSEMVNWSSTEAVKIKKAGAMRRVTLVFFKVLHQLSFHSMRSDVEARGQKNLLHQRDQLSPAVFRLCSLSAINQY